MDIVTALKDSRLDLRLTNFNRWMFWNDALQIWEVYKTERNSDRGKYVYGTDNEITAIQYLLSDD